MNENSLRFYVGAMVSSAISRDYCDACSTECKDNYSRNILLNGGKAFDKINKMLHRNFSKIGATELIQTEIEATYDTLAKVLGLDTEDREEVIKHIDSLKKRKKNDIA